MPFGYIGKIAHIDLTNSLISIEQQTELFYRHYWGGQGFVAYYLLKETLAHTDPLGADNRLIFATGVMTGAPAGGFGRHSVGARSPLTGGIGESEAGGFWGAELKKAGFDALVIHGCSAEPVYLWIHDGEIEIKSAKTLWGLTTGETLAQIQDTFQDRLIKIAMIGPAGENLVRYACVNHDLHYAAGRTGLGAVMGSKKLKAIAVRGKGSIPMADDVTVKQISKWLSLEIKTNAGMKSMHDLGTAAGVGGLNAMGMLPTRNFQEGTFEGAKAISGETLSETMLTGRRSCYACPVQCKRVVKTTEQRPFDPVYGGPEYETIASFGSNCGVADLAAICQANAMCSAYGLDSISTGVTISFAMECAERGWLPAAAEPLDIRFGSADAMLALIKNIAYRQGIGDLLAEGTQRAAQSIGAEAITAAMQVMGQEIPLQEPRLAHLRGLGYIISPTGADHLAGAPETFFEKEGPRLQNYRSLGAFSPTPLHGFNENKLRLYQASHIWYNFANCAVLCLFVQYSFDQVRQLAQAITGWKTSMYEIMKVGERAATLARAFNGREGLDPQCNRLPARFSKELRQLPTDEAVDPATMEQARQDFYSMMGWNPISGMPEIGKLHELGIGWVVE